jgi:deoxyadenosine/deoxycytidine kinase
MLTSTEQKSFIVEGNIGAGKSTFLKIINEYLHVQVVPEPLEKWQNVGGQSHNILERFYADSNRWAYTFQTYAFITRVIAQAEHAKRNPYGVQILERSVYSDRYCFAKNCFELGSMSELEWQLYKEWFSWLVETYTVAPTGFIYLRTDPSISYERVLKRTRQEESAVPLAYIEKVHQKHEEWLVQKIGITQSLQETPVLILDCNAEFENDKAEQERHITAIMNFIQENNFKQSDFKKHSSLTL